MGFRQNRAPSRRAVAGLVMAFVLPACDTTRDPSSLFAPGDIDVLVVDAVLLVGHLLPPVHVTSTLAPSDEFTAQTIAVPDASVIVRSGATEWVYAHAPTEEEEGRYAPPADAPVVTAHTRYDLRVESQGRIATAFTETPAPVVIDNYRLLDDETLEVRRQMLMFSEDMSDSAVYAAPENQVGYLDGLAEATFAPNGSPGYQIGIFRLDLDSDLVVNLDFLDQEIVDDLTEDAKFGGSSPPLDLSDGQLRLPWFAIFFSGRHKIRLYALDLNWFDYVRSIDITESGFAGGLAGDNFERPIFHVDGGIGLFGSASVDSVGLFVLP